jgi:ubiquinone/menaquinone biosynthesis C-methylase UbiE
MEKYPYPFNDNSFNEIFAEHNFEHIYDLEKLMKEIYRISKN